MLKYSSKSFIKLLLNFLKNLFIFFKKFLMMFLCLNVVQEKRALSLSDNALLYNVICFLFA